jgi:hypothetical protein
VQLRLFARTESTAVSAELLHCLGCDLPSERQWSDVDFPPTDDRQRTRKKNIDLVQQRLVEVSHANPRRGQVSKLNRKIDWLANRVHVFARVYLKSIRRVTRWLRLGGRALAAAATANGEGQREEYGGVRQVS